MQTTLDNLPRVAEAAWMEEAASEDIDCECMVCDLPLGSRHEPIEWRVSLHFPGPYPTPGDSDMLLCEHCKEEWVDCDWSEPYNNFFVMRCVRI